MKNKSKMPIGSTAVRWEADRARMTGTVALCPTLIGEYLAFKWMVPIRGKVSPALP